MRESAEKIEFIRGQWLVLGQIWWLAANLSK